MSTRQKPKSAATDLRKKSASEKARSLRAVELLRRAFGDALEGTSAEDERKKKRSREAWTQFRQLPRVALIYV